MSKREISKFRGVELHLWSLAGAVAASPPCICEVVHLGSAAYVSTYKFCEVNL
jgi:hypothetical protein